MPSFISSKLPNNIPDKYKTFFINVFLVGSLRIFQAGLGLAATYFIVRALSKESFGEYHLILNTIGILKIFSMRGLNNAVMQSVARGYLGSYRKALPIAFLTSIIGSAILFGMAIYFNLQLNTELFWGFLIASLIFPFTHGLAQWQSFKTGKEDFKGYAKLISVNSALTSILIILSVIFIPASYLLPVAIILFIPALQNCVQTYVNLNTIPLDSEIEDGNISYGIATTFYSSFNIIAKHIDKLLLFYFLSPVALATYAAADRIAELLRNLIQDVSVVLAPKFAKTESYTANLNKILTLFAFVYGLLIVAFAFSLLPLCINFIFGDEYSDAIPYAQGLLCSVAIGNLATIRFRYVRSKLDVRSYKNVTVVTSIIRILSALIFVPALGITGAVIAAFIYRVTLSLIVEYVIRKEYKFGAL